MESCVIFWAHSSGLPDFTTAKCPPSTSSKALAMPDSLEARTGTPAEIASRATNPKSTIFREHMHNLHPFAVCSFCDAVSREAKLPAVTNHNIRM
ncbi:unnamed protein product [Porites evermanni]|uniref:Uncharacterized protein n=1 Tax=Porites evermanni TaxID=104178 RepID=A0ABN8QV63_9CNID|nr:unnamed protein product [Porites evermanni]